jgi:hypothetical protein
MEDVEETGRKPVRRWLRPALVGALAVLVIGLVAGAYALGVSGSKGDGKAAAATPSVDPTYARALAFVQCLRKNGVPNFPEPDSAGRVGVHPDSGIDLNGATYKQAEAACKTLAPNGQRQDPGAGVAGGTGSGPPAPVGSGSAVPGGQSHPEVAQYVTCMRTHGQPDFPEPNADGMFTGLDLSSPQFKAAQKACQKYLPAGAPLPPAG